MRHVHDSDFGVFVFAADDVTSMRGTLLKVPRDNVVFETGLFSGYLGPDRCFITVPEDTRVHIPTDLTGITVGFYEARSDENLAAAVSTFSDRVYQRIERDGLFEGTVYQQLRDLIIAFECANWIKQEADRVERKRTISSQMEGLCRGHPPNKYRLLAMHRPGAVVMLLLAIILSPQTQDWKLVLEIPVAELPHGFTRTKLFEAVNKLKAANRISPEQLKELKTRLRTASDLDDNDQAFIDNLPS
jgi:hypothetical protein